MFSPRKGEGVFASSCLTLFGPQERTYEAAHDLYNVVRIVALFLGPVVFVFLFLFFTQCTQGKLSAPGVRPFRGYLHYDGLTAAS